MSKRLHRALYRLFIRKGAPLLVQETFPLRAAFLRDITTKLGSERIETFRILGPKEFRSTMHEYFSSGSDSDIDLLLSLLPTFLRYSHASSVIIDAIANCNGSLKANLSVVEGCILISRLYRTPDNLRACNPQSSIDFGKEHWAKQVGEQLNRNHCSRYQDSKFDIYNAIIAFNEVFREAESKRKKGVTVGYLLDDVFDPERNPYALALPVAHAIMASEVLNTLGFQSFGVPFPRYFLFRILTKSRSAEEKGEAMADFMVESAPKEVTVSSLTGRWVGIGDNGLVAYDIALSIDANKHSWLTAVNMTPSVDAHFPFSPTIPQSREYDWKLDLGNIDSTTSSKLCPPIAPHCTTPRIQIDTDTPSGNQPRALCLEVAKPYSLSMTVDPPTASHPLWSQLESAPREPAAADARAATKLIVLGTPAQHLGPMKGLGEGASDPHFELLIDSSASSDAQYMPNSQRLYLVKIDSLHRCLFFSGAIGILPVTPHVYLNLLASRSRFKKDDTRYLDKVTTAAGGLAVAARMAMNISTISSVSSVSNVSNVSNVGEHLQPSYWNGINRLLEIQSEID